MIPIKANREKTVKIGIVWFLMFLPLIACANDGIYQRCLNEHSGVSDSGTHHFVIHIFGGRLELPIYYELISRDIRVHHFTRSDGNFGRLSTGTSENMNIVIEGQPEESFKYKSLGVEIHKPNSRLNARSVVVRSGEEFMLITDNNDCQWLTVLNGYKEK
ncbi:MAG TPA: hypothetical protein VF268_01915 [Gammaproteobacteria bacterium]